VTNVKKGFLLGKRKMYLLLREEREEVYEFIKEQLRKEYIRPLNSLQITLVFFVGYKYLKKWTIKNNYPLSLILDTVENIGNKKIFTKLDL